MVRGLFVVLLLFCGFLAEGQSVFIPGPSPYRAYYPYYNGRRITPATSVERNSKKYYYTVLFKDSTKITMISKIDEHKRAFYLAIDQPGMTRSIRPSETLQIARRTSNGKIMVGMPMDSCWLFKIAEGKLDLYSVLSEENKPRFVVAFQRDDGPLLPVTQETVSEAIKDDQELVEQVVDDRDKLVALLVKYNKKKSVLK